MPLQDTDPTPSFGGFGFTQDKVARALGVSVVTVKREAAAALHLMAAMIWED